MKKILCPTDFSEVADNAIVYAAKLAKAMNADLTLFNVQSLFELTPVEAVRGKSMTIQSAIDRLEEKSKEVSQVFKVSCYSDIESSATSFTRLVEQKARSFDLIVMGSNGADDYFQFFFGSNTYNVIRDSNVPLMLIPPDCGYQDITLIIYAFDYLKNNDLPVEQLTAFVKAVQANLFVLNVVKDNHSYETEDRIKGIQKLLKAKHKNDFVLNFDTIYSSEIPQAINSYVLRNEADVLALCTQHKSLMERLFHKSVIKYISGIANYPVYVFHH